jgi:hypothetical protein
MSRLRLSLCGALLLSSLSTTFAEHFPPPGYVGNPSYNLQDSPQLQKIKIQMELLEQESNQLEKQLKQKENQLAQKENELEKAQDSIEEAQVKLQNFAASKSQLESQIATLENETDLLEQNIALLQQNIALESQALGVLQGEVQAKQAEIAAKNCLAEDEICKAELLVLREDLKVKQLEAKAQQQKVGFLKDGLQDANQKTKQKKAELSSAEKNLAALINSKSVLETQVANNKQKVQSLRPEVQTLKAEVNLLSKQSNQKNQDFVLKKQEFERERKELIARLIDANRDGVSQGLFDGRVDGQRLARDMGYEFGTKDGQLDGYVNGEQAGKQREYSSGYQVGSKEGLQVAKNNGEANGRREGEVAGNKAAATRDGEIDGRKRAEASDAASVGTKQGQADGMAEAVSDGKVKGYKIGEGQGIQEEETKALASQTVLGSYAGSFAHGVPSFPFNYVGLSFNTNKGPNKGLVQYAWADGYVYTYQVEIRQTYELMIRNEYQGFYNQAYQVSYQNAFSQYYANDFEQGKRDGYSEAYNKNYPIYYKKYFDEARSYFYNNPNKGSSEYIQTYNAVEAATYARVYEEIRQAYYKSVKAKTYADNIDLQVEKFRKERKDQVHALYASNAVLKYNDSKIIDAGINGIAANDGVYQPKENVAVSVRITNYGKTAAIGVKVLTNDGKVVDLPAIPASSVVIVQGAALTSVPDKLGENVDVTPIVKATQVGSDPILKRHFKDATSGLLNSAKEQVVALKYPLSIADLKTTTSLLLGEENSLSATVKSIANRVYTGPINLAISTDRPDFISESLSDLSEVGASVAVKGSKILATEEKDAYSSVKFKVTISQQGVTLGESNTFRTTIRAKFKQKSGTPVILVDSTKSAERLLDLISDLNGIENVSVLDSSLSANSSAVKDGVKSADVVIIDDGSGATFKTFESAMKAQSGKLILVYDDQGASARLKALSSWKNHDALPFKVTSLGSEMWFYLSNPLIDSSHKSSLSALKVESGNVVEALKFAKVFALGDDALITSVANISGSSFFSKTKSQAQLMETLVIKMLKESFRISSALKITGNKAYLESLKGSGLLQNNLNAKASADKQAVGLYLAAYDAFYSLKKGLEDVSSIKDKFDSSARKAILGGPLSKGLLEDMKEADDKVKKLDKNLEKVAEANKAFYAPY